MRGGDDSRLYNSPLGDINGMAGNDNDLNLVKCSVGGIDTTEEDGIIDMEKGKISGCYCDVSRLNNGIVIEFDVIGREKAREIGDVETEGKSEWESCDDDPNLDNGYVDGIHDIGDANISRDSALEKHNFSMASNVSLPELSRRAPSHIEDLRRFYQYSRIQHYPTNRC
ncbi:hypothetical protein BOTCAL_0379g00100 [Botryotinia calthae]|uniref:Uncharacterized protein n=1 Tax=Botryotinia calthae TaxID=38488 RepID=A0A4Y8CSD2_9HELO|nr:hypothetical protein BOTCAL_0379g00100 [Botryotinia calthae]